jgi:hypothetical protein
VLINKNKLFGKHISIPFNQMLKDIIARFENFIGLFNICETINKTHILLANTFGIFLKFVWS